MSDDKSFYSTFFYIMGALAVGCVILIVLASNITSEVAEYKPEEVVVANIKPVGSVYVAGESEPEMAPAEQLAAADAAPAASAEPRSGEVVYNTKCMSCHSTGVANAPKPGDAAAWAPRIAAGRDALMANATNGLNAMPPKGLCMDCSDDELMAAIDYMVSNSQ
ncbi:MAG TPA: c-type cytochrome [Gammaproteobacteria bacterium]|nr:c-type cytochrome [Gammaproteobacteria bacterium]